MNEVKIFENPKFGRIRTITDADGRTLFCATDAAKALGYAAPRNAVARHCTHALKRCVGVQTGIRKDETPIIQQIDMLFIPEGDLCRLAAKSELPGASEFESWIFDEVVPTVLRSGSYTTPGTTNTPPVPPFQTPAVSPGELAKLIDSTRQVMLDMGSAPVAIGAMTMTLLQLWGIPVPRAFAREIPGQLCLFETPALTEWVSP